LLAQRDRVQVALVQPSAEAERWREAMKRVLDFGRAAGEAIRDGRSEDRRELLAGVASNLTLKDRKLALQLKKPFAVLAENAPNVHAGPTPASNPSAPTETSLNQQENRAMEGGSAPDFQDWCAIVKDVGTAVWKELAQEN